MVESSYFWSTVVLLAAGTFLIRYSVIGLLKKAEISAKVREVFTYIPAAILPALITPGVFFHQGKVEALAGKERMVVLLAASVVTWVWRSTLVTLFFGMVALYLVTHLMATQ